MQWHGLKIYYAISGICGVLASVLFHNDLFNAGCSFLYIAVYFFGCGVSSDIDDLFYKLKKEIKKIGGYSEKEIQKDLLAIHNSGVENLDECAVEIYTEEM